MHDLHVIEALVEGLLRLDPAPAGPAVVVRVAADVTLSPEALVQAYELVTTGTPLEGSRLLVEDAARSHLCEACATSWTVTRDDVAGHLLVCPSCGSVSAFDAATGLEILGVDVAAGRVGAPITGSS
jgi:Zn finger protein HypA/HybF involved in hydrogenase expression